MVVGRIVLNNLESAINTYLASSTKQFLGCNITTSSLVSVAYLACVFERTP